jgi:uncharacterized protein
MLAGQGERAVPDDPETVEAPLPLAATPQERLVGLDFTRGVAVLGILVANILSFGQPELAALWPGGSLAPSEPADAWLWLAQFVLVDGKMRGLFTLLFGAGMVLFVENAWAKGATRWLQARRLWWLLLFGLAHFYLLWRGDILTTYALCGLFALVAVRWDAIRLLAAGLTSYLAGAVYYTLGYGAAYLWPAASVRAAAREANARYLAEVAADGRVETRIIRFGDWGDYVAHGAAAHAWNWVDVFVNGWLETLPLMVIGMGLYRAGLFDGRFDPALQRKWGWIAALAGVGLTLPLGLWAVWQGPSYDAAVFAQVGLSSVTRLPLILGLAALLALWGPRATGWLGRRFTAAGRMAFTNYLATSALMLVVFHGWGLNQFGKLTRAELYGVTLAAWAVILLWSQPWLARFRYGPLEWLWRCLTYERLFALRR